MIRFFLNRPVGVLMAFLGVVLFSLAAFLSVPISLLPPIEIPRISIYFSYPNASPRQIEEQILGKARPRLITLSHLVDIRTSAENGFGRAELTYEYGTNMKLAYIDANEQMDRMAEFFPSGLNRPLISLTATSDIPIVRLQVIPKDTSNYVAYSDATEKIIKRRLEQLEGVSLVDINGLRQKIISIEPKAEALKAYGLTTEVISKAIRDFNQPLGAISVKDGIYRYYLKIEAILYGLNDVKNIPVWLPGGISQPLQNLATVTEGVVEPPGYHLFNGREGFVITVHKQEAANMLAVMERVHATLPQLREDFPYLQFFLTQDQSALLDASISNLSTSLLYGGVFAFLVLFLFMGNFHAPLIMGISIPVSLILSLLFFYLFGVSINIISLSGLALGIGMLVDNAIVIIDNINRNSQKKNVEGIANATGEMFAPLLSSVLTTLAVFVPLIFLGGITGPLFYDQAISVTIILGVSLLVSFILIPVLYKAIIPRNNFLKSDSRLFSLMARHYEKGFFTVISKPWLVFLFCALLLSGGVWIAIGVPKEGLPSIAQDDFLISIEWNESITPEINKERCIVLSDFLSNYGINEVEAGISTFLLKKEKESLYSALVYFKSNRKKPIDEVKNATEIWLREKYPLSSVTILGSPNAFSKTFASEKMHWELHVRNPAQEATLDIAQLDTLQKQLSAIIPGLKSGQSNETTTTLEITIHYDRLFLYNIDPESLLNELQRWLGTTPITDIKNIGESIPVVYQGSDKDFDQLIKALSLSNKEGVEYPLQLFTVMVNDAILKVDTINRLLKTNAISSREEFVHVLHEAGLIRLKPILMTTTTTVLAITPILFSAGLGAELQRPFVWALSGGLITGTFTALWLIPVLYYEVGFRFLRRLS